MNCRECPFGVGSKVDVPTVERDLCGVVTSADEVGGECMLRIQLVQGGGILVKSCAAVRACQHSS